MSARSSMQAMIRSWPPHWAQVSTSMPKTRLRRCAFMPFGCNRSAGAFDVLVATTIIENGIDVPNANTIVIDGAETLGLAQLHQLRGRVGRSDRDAHALLLTGPAEDLSEEAGASDVDALHEVGVRLVERYGPLPAQASNLLETHRLRCEALGIATLRIGEAGGRIAFDDRETAVRFVDGLLDDIEGLPARA